MVCTGGKAVNLKNILDSIQVDTSRPRASYLRRVVQKAAKGLVPSGSGISFNPESGLSGHLFVLTSNLFALDRIVPDNKFQVHTICAGPIPWSLPREPASNGWCIVNRSHDSFQPRHRSDLQSRLCSLTRSARSGFLPEHLENVQISISSGSNNVIEGVIGSTCFASLRLGELRTVLVKTQLANTVTSSPLLSGFPRGLRTPSGQVDIERELDAALVDRSKPALTIQLKYEHSALPSQTVCENSRDVYIRSHEAESSFVSENSHQVVQARLAFHLAMSQNPRRGFGALKNQFATDYSEYTQAVMDELKYQARVLDRFDCGQSTTSPPKFAHGVGQDQRKDSHAQAANLDLAAFPSPPAPLRPRGKNSDSNDQARQIWTALRVRKRPQSNMDQTRIERTQSIASLLQIKETAARNRRSLGSDTVRSLRYEKMQENVAPWL